jgi:hypothetical protein
MKRAGVFAILSIGAALAGIAFACGSNPIPIATVLSIRCEISDAGDGDAGCPAGQFCSRTTCATSAGSCEIVQSPDCGASGYECGCDGISYRNSCDLQLAGVGRAGEGQCIGQSGVQPIGLGCLPGSQPSSCPNKTVCANVASAPRPPFLNEDASTFSADCREGVQKAVQNAEAFAKSNPFLPPNVLNLGVCWRVPDCSVPGSRVLGICDQGCIDDCLAIREGGFFFSCPEPDASAAP